ncbi:MAG TPA: sensor domain-containing diguanylate cyclase [Rhodocyclaceae bacterium]|nr:sensor domain-containing diguanylate cyclase [Rhodocyclaceae bacterium]
MKPLLTVPSSRCEIALDQAGSAGLHTLRLSLGLAASIVAMGLGVVLFGHIQLAAFPQFATFQASVVLLEDAITSLILFSQFRYRRLPAYAVLGCAFLFNALVMVPFLLSFPGALKAEGGVIGGPQSAIWVWHLWHVIFPAMVAALLAAEAAGAASPVPERRVAPVLAGAAGLALALVLALTLAVTWLHDYLPVMIAAPPQPMTSNFYGMGILAAVVTAVAMGLAWRRGWTDRSILYLWLAVALTASLADVAASLSANARYTVGWYFGRVESMIAGSVLLIVFLSEMNGLYQRLAGALRELSEVNRDLLATVEQKESLVADLRRTEEQVRQLAYYDTLTGLPNRRLLVERMNQALTLAKRHHYSMAIMFLDLDRFKEVNDTLGHEAGDELLRQVAGRLTGCVRASDMVARSGGDEFIVVLAEINRPSDASLLAEKIIGALGVPFELGGHHLQVTTSIGIAVFPTDGSDDMKALMRKADTAMYAAKRAGRNTYRFYSDLDESRGGESILSVPASETLH